LSSTSSDEGSGALTGGSGAGRRLGVGVVAGAATGAGAGVAGGVGGAAGGERSRCLCRHRAGRLGRDQGVHLEDGDVVGRCLDRFLQVKHGRRRARDARQSRRHERHAAALLRGEVHDSVGSRSVAGGLVEAGDLHGAALEAAELGVVEVVEKDVEGDRALQVLRLEALAHRHRRVVDGEDGDGVSGVDVRRGAGAGQGGAEVAELRVRREDVRDVVAPRAVARRRRAEDEEDGGGGEDASGRHDAQGNGSFSPPPAAGVLNGKEGP
jgi:hypothetical protein